MTTLTLVLPSFPCSMRETGPPHRFWKPPLGLRISSGTCTYSMFFHFLSASRHVRLGFSNYGDKAQLVVFVHRGGPRVLLRAPGGRCRQGAIDPWRVWRPQKVGAVVRRGQAEVVSLQLHVGVTPHLRRCADTETLRKHEG